MEENRERLIPLGDRMELNPDRQLNAEAQFEQDITYAIKSKSHLWTVVIVHRATPSILASFDNPDPTDMPLLDADTIVSRPITCCYVCGCPYADTRARMRTCKGDMP
jgi:hypothetical protein